VYKEIPAHLEGVFEKAPAIRKLLVEVKDAPKFKAEVARQGSPAHSLYQLAESEIRDNYCFIP
jgi:hypothetical protein